MNRSRIPLFRLGILLMIAGSASAGFAQGNPPGTVSSSASYMVTRQPTVRLGDHGELGWNGHTINANITWQMTRAFAAGVSVRFDDQEWTIPSFTSLGEIKPWAHLQRPGASLNMSLALSRTLLVGISPAVDWALDSNADVSDACTYGAVVGVAKVVSPRLTLGGGASVVHRFYSVTTSPFALVNWRITEKLRLANANPSSPLGGAGVEVRYAITPKWEVGAGGVWRSDRWRIVQWLPGGGTVGEFSGIPLLAHVSRRLGPKGRFDLYMGATVANQLTVLDGDGRRLGREEYGFAPTLSASVGSRFL